MGRKTRDLSRANGNSTAVSPSVREALLFTTMSIIGLPVEVQVKDGSIYSGIFHTACFEKDYGIVLKKAKMTKKGKKDANLANGSVVDTLVVHSDDLVQVVAKGHLLSADGIAGSVSNEDTEAVNRSIRPIDHSDNEKKLKKNDPKVLVVETNQVNQARGSNHNENKSDYGVSNGNVGVDLASNVEKGPSKKVVTQLLGSAVATENGRANGIHSEKIEEASVAPVGSDRPVDVRQVGKEKVQKKKGLDQKFGAQKDDTIHEFHYSSGGDPKIPQIKTVNGVQVDISLRISSNGSAFGSPVPSLVKPDAHDYGRATSVDSSSLAISSSDLSSSLTTTVNLSSQSCTIPSASQAATAAPKFPVSNLSGKEFKLNPGAKTFLPMFSISKSAAPPASAAAASMAFIPNNTSMVPVAVTPPESGISSFAPQSSLPVKFVPYSNMVAVNGDSSSQYAQPVAGQVGSRPQPVRYANQYNPLQAGPAYVHPTSQPVMVGLGRLGGQVVYMPVSHNVLQGSTIPSQVTPRPQLTTQVHLAKHQGSAAAPALQVCVTQPPYIATAQQQYTFASHVPFSQPTYPVVRPMQVPGANAHFGSKFF